MQLNFLEKENKKQEKREGKNFLCPSAFAGAEETRVGNVVLLFWGVLWGCPLILFD